MRTTILKIGILFFALTVLCVSGAGTAYAQAFDLKTISEIPRYTAEADNGMSTDEFLSKSELHTEKIPNDEYLDFHIRLPEGWIKATDDTKMSSEDEADLRDTYLYGFGQNGEAVGTAKSAADKKAEEKEDKKDDVLSRRLLGKIAKYYEPTNYDLPSFFEVRALRLDYEVTARNWFLRYVLNNSYILHGMKVHSDIKVEALYIQVDRGISYVVRTVVVLNGSRIVTASYIVPETRWMKERSNQDHSIQSFEFLAPQRTRLELTKSFSFLDLLTFNYPSGWFINMDDIQTIDALDAKLFYMLDDSKINGEMEVHVISVDVDTTIKDELDYYIGELEERNLVIGDYIESMEQFELKKHIFHNSFDAYQVRGTKRNKVIEHEYWIGIMVEDRFFYIVTLLTPSRKADFYTWARNIEAFEILVESLRPVDAE